MVKKPTISTISSGYYSRQALNTNFENLRDAFDNTLSLDGSTPNAMQADLDMNNNDILNAQEISTNGLRIDGVLIGSSDIAAAGASLYSDSYTGDGSTVAYTMSYQPFIKDNTQVYIDGVYQAKDGYSIAGTTLTFSEAPPLNSDIEIVVARSLDTLSGDADIIQYNQGDSSAVDTTAGDKLREFVSVKDFGAVGDGITDDTAAVILANAASSFLLFPAGHTFNLQNWVPLANTKIVATGSTINRHDDTEYGATGSSAAVVITNNDIEIDGGTWGKSSGATQALSWSGSVVVENGSATIRNAKFIDTWGGVFGHELQNGSLVCSFLRIESCEFDGCSHNTYLADIENFEFVNNHSHNSDRDGLRAYRNMQNLLITGNHLYDNGDGNPTQSQDGADLFFGGKRCIVTNNFIYSNVSNGIDIKRGSSSAGETVFGEKFIIANNHIYSNGFSGISFSGDFSPVQYNENVQIIGNQIYENTLYGIRARLCKNLIVAENIVHDNNDTGIRVEETEIANIDGNIIYDNDSVGLFCLSSASNINVTDNTVYNSSGGPQTGAGIFLSCSGRCTGNHVFGTMSSRVFSDVTDGSLKGVTMYARVDSSVSGLQYIGSFGKFGAVTGAKLTSLTNSTVDFLIAKRDASTGAFEGILYSNSAESLTANLPLQLTAGTWDSTDNRLIENELLYIVVNSASVAFAMGMVELEVIN